MLLLFFICSNVFGHDCCDYFVVFLILQRTRFSCYNSTNMPTTNVCLQEVEEEEDKATYTDPYLPIYIGHRQFCGSIVVNGFSHMLENKIIVVVAFYVRDTVNFPFDIFFIIYVRQCRLCLLIA